MDGSPSPIRHHLDELASDSISLSINKEARMNANEAAAFTKQKAEAS
jgi:hypothetical protein